ncbi:MAG: DNA-binding protein WhiA [Gaiellales bacterium]
MSFAEEVRLELVVRPPGRACCRSAFLSGLIRHSGVLQVRGGELAVRFELSEPAAARLAFSLLHAVGAECEILSFREQRFQRRRRVVMRVSGDRGLQLLHEIGLLSAALAPLHRPPPRLLARACCRGSYLRGAFAAGGSVSPPRRPAHLEIRTGDPDSARHLVEVAGRDGIELRAVARRGHALAYAKRRDTIRDLLALVGAHDAVLSLDEADPLSRTREAANRLTNCDRANLARTSRAAHRQRQAIAAIDLERLDPKLRQVAELRLRHPESSLAELARCARPPLTKSTVARRMRELVGGGV